MVERQVFPGDDLQAQGASGKLSRTAAHEINNPLDSLLNLLYLLETEATFSSKGRRYLTLAQEEVRRISRIARASLDGHEGDDAPQTISVGQLLASVLEFYKQRFDSAGIAVRFRQAVSTDVPVRVEPLRRVFSNLLLNAAEAMPQGGDIRARVCPGQEWSGKRRRGVRITVADNGCGIGRDVLGKLFQQPFTTKPEGHGVGLPFVKSTMQKHQGTVHVRSSIHPAHHGTVFSLFLPAA